jgi:hypothetical protein
MSQANSAVSKVVIGEPPLREIDPGSDGEVIRLDRPERIAVATPADRDKAGNDIAPAA